MKNKIFILFILIFIIGTGSVFASENFTENELNQINSFFNTNFTLDRLNSGFNALKRAYPSVSKLNVFFLNQNDDIYLFANNGTFSNDLDYISVWTPNNQNFNMSLYYSNSSGVTINNEFTIIKITYDNVYQQYGNESNGFRISYDNFIQPSYSNNILNSEYILTTISTQAFYFYNPLTSKKESCFSANYINLQNDNPGSGDNSGDTGGGTTPSGDDPGTSTPDYSEKLDNIQGSIDNVNQNLDNIENKIPTSGEVQNIINGTIENAFGEGSGELTGEQIENLQDNVNEIMGDIVPANNFIGMFNQIITAFSDALLGTGEEIIEFNHRGEHYVISSNDINLPIEEIKDFISIFFNVAIVMAMALSINWIIRKMEEGDVISILHMGDADMYFYEDLNLF